jgi:putative hydrolase of the HAD superfamily
MLSKNMIKAILFDMVGVLFFKKEGYSATTSDEINAQNIENLFNHLNDKKLLEDIKEKLKLNGKEVKRAVVLIPQKYDKFDELWKLLPNLKKKFKLAVINNGNSIAQKYWKKKFDFSIFDLFLNSAEAGIKKPNPKIFLFTCKILKVKLNDCLFMDDSLENIESAKKLEMQTVWWNKEDDKIEILNNLVRTYGFKRV